MTKINKNSYSRINSAEYLSDIKFFGGSLLFNTFYFVVKNILSIFAGELTVRPSFKCFIVAAFFIALNQNSLGCCFSSGSRCKALLTVSHQSREQQSFLFLNIFNSTVRPSSIKNAKGTKYSSTQSTPTERNAVIILSLIGIRNCPYLYSLRKAIFEFLKEETCGNIFTELRLVKKIEAARTLFPESKKSLIGKTVSL